MKGLLYLAWHYLIFHRFKTIILITAITLLIYIPLGLNVLVNNSAEQLTQRADNTPLLIGTKGSPLDLVLNSLYFDESKLSSFMYQDFIQLKNENPVKMIPLNTQFKARGFPVIGTTLSYFDFRAMILKQGQMMGLLGECVIGANIAESLRLKVGDSLVTSPESLFDLAGVYPLKMKITGILETTYTADDNAIFTDIKTAWVIGGFGHGHQDLNRPEAISGVLKRTQDTITANASVRQFTEITSDNIDSFHFHGNSDQFPITAIIALPDNQKQSALLQGKFQVNDITQQIVRPDKIIRELMSTIFTVRHYILIGAFIMGLSTLIMIMLIFMLSQQLRRGEILTATKIGASRYFVLGLISFEVFFVTFISIALALILMLLTQQYGMVIIQNIIFN